MRRIAVLTFALLVATISAAHADTSDSPQKDRNVALGLSIVGSVVGPLVTIVGAQQHSGTTELVGGGIALLGPTAGEWYAGKPFTRGLAMRGAGTAIAFSGALFAGEGGNDTYALGAGITGISLFFLGTVDDIAQAGKATDGWNARHHLQVAPTELPTAHGRAPGLSLAGTF
jgi:hypothetical protein